MKIYPSSIFKARLTSKVSTMISKSFRYDIIIDKARKDIDSIIVLGNGNVDDLVTPIVCHHLNGSKIVGITKPDRKRTEAISGFSAYVSGTKINKIALIMDQEEEDLDTIFTRINDKLMNLNIRSEMIVDYSRIKQFRCKYGSRTFYFILIISGLDCIPSRTHKIEDHLINGALKLSRILNASLQDSKDNWNSLDVPLRKEILNDFVNDGVLSSEVFPQHFAGLQLLEE